MFTAYGMRGSVYVTVGRPSVRPSVRLSVCPLDLQQQRRAASLLLNALWAGDID